MVNIDWALAPAHTCKGYHQSVYSLLSSNNWYYNCLLIIKSTETLDVFIKYNCGQLSDLTSDRARYEITTQCMYAVYCKRTC